MFLRICLVPLIYFSLGCTKQTDEGADGGIQPSPYPMFTGLWTLVDSVDVGEVVPIPGYSFTPVPPKVFDLNFTPKNMEQFGVGWFGIPGLEYFTDTSLQTELDGLPPSPESQPPFSWNNSVYFGDFSVEEGVPTLRILVVKEAGDFDSLSELAVYQKVEGH